MASEAYLNLLEELKSLHHKKSAGYAGAENPDAWANFRMAEGFGVTPLQGCLVRMSDKYIRIQNLMKNPDNDKVGESIRDTLLDLSSYALIVICLLDEMAEIKDTTKLKINVPDYVLDKLKREGV